MTPHPGVPSAIHDPGSGANMAPNVEWGMMSDLMGRVVHLERTATDQGRDVSSLIGSRKSWRWVVGICGPVILGAMVTVLLWSTDKVSTSSERVGATNARIEVLWRMIDTLTQDIRDLRLEIRKMSGLEPRSSKSSMTTTRQTLADRNSP
jgi:hypothetical protein